MCRCAGPAWSIVGAWAADLPARSETETTPTLEFKLQLVFFAHALRDGLKPGLKSVFQTPSEIIDARRRVSAFDLLGMRGNLINNETRGRSNAGDSSLPDWGWIGDAVVELVSCLLEGALGFLL